MQDLFKSDIKLELQPRNSKKCQLLDTSNLSNAEENKIEYLGYKLLLKPLDDKKSLTAEYCLTSKKYNKIQTRINKAFLHFTLLSIHDIKRARRDLLDALNYITGNFRLSNSKSHAKVGLYYTNDLLDNLSDLKSLTEYLHKHKINPYDKNFSTPSEKQQFIKSLQDRINKIDLEQRWRDRKMFDFPLSRIKEISKWL